MIMLALLVPVMMFLMLLAMAALEDRMFPSPQPPPSEPAIPEQPAPDKKLHG
ncbi:hypothetical protein [Streptomyces sp. UG1]|uniref:hypothetical protein n=1 Tax=Streptomyces sp. UG1 TaxID=3417652 RepID=UPI003CE77286